MALTDQTIPPPAELKRIREGLGLSQSEFASALGFGRNGERTVWQWENDPTFKPTGLAWAAMRYLAGLDTMYRHLLGDDREKVRAILPECLR